MNAPLTQDDAFDTPQAADLAKLKPAKRRFRWLALLALPVVAGVAAVVWFSSGEDDTSWQTQEAVRGNLLQRVTAVGQLEPVDVVEVGSDLTGKLSEVAVEKNAVVKAGDVLARLDPEPFEHAVDRARSQVSSARAGVVKAKAEAEDAEATRARTERLVNKGVSSATDLEAATLQAKVANAAVSTARATLEQAQASLADAEKDLADATIRSPIDGVVIQRYVDPGQTVVSSMSATALFEVASDLSALEVEVGIDEADVARVQKGQTASFTVSAFPSRTFEAEVVTVDLAPDPDESVVTYNANLRVDNNTGELRPGMTATADILVERLDNVLQVPSLALGYRPSRDPFSNTQSHGDTVYVLQDGAAVAVQVTQLGTDGSNTAVEPLEGGALTEGARIVLGGGS